MNYFNIQLKCIEKYDNYIIGINGIQFYQGKYCKITHKLCNLFSCPKLQKERSKI